MGIVAALYCSKHCVLACPLTSTQRECALFHVWTQFQGPAELKRTLRDLFRFCSRLFSGSALRSLTLASVYALLWRT